MSDPSPETVSLTRRERQVFRAIQQEPQRVIRRNVTGRNGGTVDTLTPSGLRVRGTWQTLVATGLVVSEFEEGPRPFYYLCTLTPVVQQEATPDV